MKKHTSAVSALTLDGDEKSVLSGSWDKNVYDWDLNTGQVKREYKGSGGQISAIEMRPASSLPVPEESGEVELVNGTFSSNNADKPLPNGVMPTGNGTASGVESNGDGTEDAPGSPADADSLFGGGDADSLFGDNDNGVGAPSGGNFGDEDDEFSRAIEMNVDEQEHAIAQADVTMSNADVDAPDLASSVDPVATATDSNDSPTSPSAALPNGLPHADSLPDRAPSPTTQPAEDNTQDALASTSTTFLAASIDGTLRIWDRRAPSVVARIPTARGVPPWCMGACWSPDGNFIYAGRRNGTVEEYSLHKGLKAVERVFKFPGGSGAVSAVRAMPNGKHLIWYVSLLLSTSFVCAPSKVYCLPSCICGPVIRHEFLS